MPKVRPKETQEEGRSPLSVMRPGKTARDKRTGAWQRTRDNKLARAKANRARALGGAHGQKAQK